MGVEWNGACSTIRQGRTVDMPLTCGKSDRKRNDEFVFYDNVVFVTYTRSRIDDKGEFHHRLVESLERSLARDWATHNVSVEIFGSKELHEDGTPHYHVALRFSRKVYWRKARTKLSVWVIVNGRREIDTLCINIKRKKTGESDAKFLGCVQTYIAKEGDVFGKWIVETGCTDRRDR